MKYIITTIITLFILGVLAISPIIAYTTDTEVTFTVESKERIVKEDSSKYLIFTDKGIYQNTDTLWYWKWRSSDIYGELKEGKTYEARVYGFRVGFFSWYKNIIEVAELKD